MLSEFFNENDYSAESELVREEKWKKITLNMYSLWQISIFNSSSFPTFGYKSKSRLWIITWVIWFGLVWPSFLLPRLWFITWVMIYNQGYETNYYFISYYLGSHFNEKRFLNWHAPYHYDPKKVQYLEVTFSYCLLK